MINGLYFQNRLVWREGGTQWEQQDTQLVECCCVFAVHPLISGQTECENSTLPSHLIPSFLSAAQYRSDCHNFPWVKGMHAHTRYKLVNEMQQHVCHTPLLYGVCCNHGNSWAAGSWWWFIDRYYVEGQLGQEKTDLEVRNTDCQWDVASAIQLESSFRRMSHCSVCQPVSAHQRTSQTGFEACEECNMLSLFLCNLQISIDMDGVQGSLVPQLQSLIFLTFCVLERQHNIINHNLTWNVFVNEFITCIVDCLVNVIHVLFVITHWASYKNIFVSYLLFSSVRFACRAVPCQIQLLTGQTCCKLLV